MAPPPVFERLVGIELRPRVARLARAALQDVATIIEGDARRSAPERCHAVLFFDLLHMMPFDDQERLLGSVAARARAVRTDRRARSGCGRGLAL